MATEIGTATVKVIAEFDPDIPRIQVLELPMEREGPYSRTPFAIIIDGVTEPADVDMLGKASDPIKEALGAKAVLIFQGRVAV